MEASLENVVCVAFYKKTRTIFGLKTWRCVRPFLFLLNTCVGSRCSYIFQILPVKSLPVGPTATDFSLLMVFDRVQRRKTSQLTCLYVLYSALCSPLLIWIKEIKFFSDSTTFSFVVGWISANNSHSKKTC